MKVFRICPAPGYLPEFRKLHRLRDKSFSEQIAIFRAENVLLPGGWAQAMESEGCEVFEALPQDWASQARWAAENDCSGLLLKPNQLFEILKAQIKAFQPDVLFLHGGAFYVISRRQRYELRSVLANPLVITGLWGDELPRGNTYESYLGDVDLIFCTSSAYKKHFDDARIPATMIGNCFDDTIKYEPASRKCYDLIFCGTTGYGYTDHIQRYEKLIRLMSETNLRIWAFAERLRGSPSFAFKFKILNIARRVPGAVLLVIRRLTGRVLANLVRLALLLRLTELPAEALLGPKPGADPLERYFDDKKPLRRLFHGRVRKPLVNTSDYYKLVSEAKIVLNLHRDEGADIGNIRCYEVTGLGSCLLTDRGDELREFFDVENDIVTFKTVEECVVKVRHLLAHPEEVERIAKNGQRTTLARHTVKHRARVITATLRARLTGAAQSSAKRSRSIVLASYDFDKHPISYDISFFLQAAEIYRKKAGAAGVAVAMIHPADMQNLAGVSKTADAIVDKHSRDFRVFHICVQIAELMPTLGVFNAKDRSLQNLFSGEDHGKIDVIPFPGPDVDHHSAYYRLVNENPELVTGFSASVEAHRYVTTWLNPILKGRKLLCVTLRQYRYDPERNSKSRCMDRLPQSCRSE